VFTELAAIDDNAAKLVATRDFGGFVANRLTLVEVLHQIHVQVRDRVRRVVHVCDLHRSIQPLRFRDQACIDLVACRVLPVARAGRA
jgi:hypothetical protein